MKCTDVYFDKTPYRICAFTELLWVECKVQSFRKQPKAHTWCDKLFQLNNVYCVHFSKFSGCWVDALLRFLLRFKSWIKFTTISKLSVRKYSPVHLHPGANSACFSKLICHCERSKVILNWTPYTVVHKYRKQISPSHAVDYFVSFSLFQETFEAAFKGAITLFIHN